MYFAGHEWIEKISDVMYEVHNVHKTHNWSDRIIKEKGKKKMI